MPKLVILLTQIKKRKQNYLRMLSYILILNWNVSDTGEFMQIRFRSPCIMVVLLIFLCELYCTNLADIFVYFISRQSISIQGVRSRFLWITFDYFYRKTNFLVFSFQSQQHFSLHFFLSFFLFVLFLINLIFFCFAKLGLLMCLKCSQFSLASISVFVHNF